MFTSTRLMLIAALAAMAVTLSCFAVKDGPPLLVVETSAGKVTINPATGAQQVKGKISDGPVSPDGTRIAYIKTFTAAGKSFSELCVADLKSNGSTANELQLTNGAGNPSDPQWTPDGKSIVYIRGEGKFQQVYSTSALSETRSERRVSAGGARSWLPRLAPDGTVAYVVERGREGKATLVDLMIASGNTHTALVKNVSITEMAWSPDGTKIAYSTYSELVIVNVADGKSEKRDFNTIDERLNAFHATSLAWHPDGKSIAALLYFSGGRASGLGGAGGGEPQPMFGEREAFIIPLQPDVRAKWFSLKSQGRRICWSTVS